MLSAHKYIPPVMEIVAEMPETRVEGFLAAGHAATITGWGIFEPFVERHRLPVVVAGFEPLDILAGLVKLLELIRDGRAEVVEHLPALRHPEGNRAAQEALWRVFRPLGGRWRGIAHVPNGNLRLRDEWARVDARRALPRSISAGCGTTRRRRWPQECLCGDIMAGIASPQRLPAVRQGVPARHARSAPAWCGARAPAGSGTSTAASRDLAEALTPADGARMNAGPVDAAAIALKHGAGGRAMRALIERVFVAGAAPSEPGRRRARGDGRRRRDPLGDRWLVITTDSHVVQPIFFPGRRHRPARRRGHGQRPGDDGRHRGAGRSPAP